MKPRDIPLTVLESGLGLPLPSYESAGAAGADLCAAVTDSIHLTPGDRVLIPTGIAIALPQGWEAQVRSRSGLALKSGITVLNAPGTIDSDYRGEIGVILINLGSETVEIQRGMRIAQLVVAPVVQAQWVEISALSDTVRGKGGFGSTGTGENGEAD